MEPITSRQNPHFRKLLELHKRKERESLGQFLCEGEREIALAKEIETLYYAELTPFVRECQKKAKEVVAISLDLLEQVSYRGNGAIAICKTTLAQVTDLKNRSLLIVCEGMEKPGNLGGILRTADCAGVEGVIVTDPVVDIFNPNVVRASLGALFCLPIVQMSSKEAVEFLTKEGYQIVVTTPSASKLYHEVDFQKPTCIVIGSESQGLSSEWLHQKDCIPVKIPMQGHVDSLNAGVSASIVMYEAIRQRNTLPR